MEKGNAAKEKLFGNTNTLEGQIHQIMIDGSNQVMPDWSKDQIMIKARRFSTSTTNDITDCKTDKFLIDKSKIVHETKLEQCEQVVDRSGNCQITHDYRAGVIRHYDGPYNIESCGEGCTTIWLGKVGDNYWPGGSCKLYTDEILFVVTNPDAITRASSTTLPMTTRCRSGSDRAIASRRSTKVRIGESSRTTITTMIAVRERHANSARIGFGIPRETASAVREPPVATLSKALVPSTSPVRSRAWVRAGTHAFTCVMSSVGYGEAFARMRIYYDAKKAIIDDAWTPPECVQNVYAINDKFAKGSYTCISMPTIGSDGCAQIDGVFVCPHHLNPSPLPGISNLCMKVNVNADYDFYKGQMDCWTDINGNLNTMPE